MNILIKKIWLLLLPLAVLASCGDSSLEDTNAPAEENTNANALGSAASTLDMPRLQGDSSLTATDADSTSGRAYVTSHGRASSVLIVHSDPLTGEVNYCTEYDRALRSQHWSCYKMHRGNMYNGAGVQRYSPDDYSLQYPADPLCVTPDLIRGQGYDHGHICPSADRLTTQLQNYQTFFLTNMQPQQHEFNAGIWADGEAALRTLARNATKCDTLYVCKGGTLGLGGLLDGQRLETRANGLIVPRYFFVAALLVKNGSYYSVGILYDQKPVAYSGGHNTYAEPQFMSVDNLETLTGYDFFCNMPDARENVVESHFTRSLWGF